MVQNERALAAAPPARFNRADGSVRPKRSNQPIQRRATDPQFPRHFVDVFDRQTFVAVPLQKAADRLFASASLKPARCFSSSSKTRSSTSITPADFAKTSALKPLAERIARHVRAGAALHADDTPVPVLDPGRGRTKTGRLWTAVRDESPYGSTAPPAAFYLYSPDRRAERAHALLKGCRGHLHADAYAGFAGLYEVDPLTGAHAPLTEVACWAHARRKIYDIHVETKSPAAAHALEMIARWHGLTPQQLFGWRRDVRRRSTRRQSNEAAEMSFAPVLVETGGPQAGPPVAPSCPTATGTIEIALGAAVVRVGPGTDLATLTKVLRAVKAAT